MGISFVIVARHLETFVLLILYKELLFYPSQPACNHNRP